MCNAVVVGAASVYVAGAVWTGRRSWRRLAHRRQGRLMAAVLTAVIVGMSWPLSLSVGLALAIRKGGDTDRT